MSQQQEVELNDLPEEVLVYVFEQMDFKTLLQSSLVCKKWNEIIGQNSAIMKKMKLVVDFNREDFQLSPEDFTRNYQMIKIIGLDKDWRNLPTLMNRYSSLRVLEIVDCDTNKIKKLNSLLARIPKLEKLSIIGCILTLQVDVSHHNCLKSLTLISDCTTLKFPKTAQLTSLRISYLPDDNSSELIDFLVGQKSLEVLAIRITSHHSQAKKARKDHNFEKLLTARFSLKKFVLDWDYTLFGSEKNFLLFMNKFANTLEELQIEQTYPESVYEMIFENFLQLNTLKILCPAPDRNEFYQNFRKNISIRELTIYGFGSDILIQRLIGKLPNIQTLVLEDIYLTKDIALSISNNLKMLKNLKVGGIQVDAFKEVSIPSLTTITSFSLDYNTIQSWKQIVTAMPNIEKLNVQHVHALNCKMKIKILTKGWIHLKHIMIGKGFKSSKAIFNLFLRNCKELKTVKIDEDAFKSYSEIEKKAILMDFERAGVEFTFYDAEALEFSDSYDIAFE